jgi:hypothetical protein
MIMRASPFPGSYDFGQADPWIFYPSVTTADIINRYFGMGDAEGLSTIILGTDGVEMSVPVPDMVEIPCGRGGHSESASQDTFY